MSEIDAALEALNKLKKEFVSFCEQHGAASEADTRVKVIDRVLKEVCGWPERSISREDHAHSGYIDYVLQMHGRRFIAVEAKREGIAFTLPRSSHKRYKLKGALATDKEVLGAIEQVRKYCDDEGIRFAVATNGYTWMIFRAIREDMPWREGSARVFRSLEHICKSFTEFWNLLSYEAVASGSLEEEFGSLQVVSRKFDRVIDRLFNADLPLQRNRLNAQLEPLIRTIFDDIADQDAVEILESCYVHNKSLRIVARDLNCIIEDRVPRFLSDQGTEDLLQGKTHSGRFGSAMSNAIHRARGELFLLLGGIGSGKTTFLKRYQRTVGKDLLNRRTLWFHIDFLKAPLNPMDLEEFVWREIIEHLRIGQPSSGLETRRNIKRVFATEIRALHETALKHGKEGTEDYERALSPYLERWQQDLSTYVPGLLKQAKPRENLAVVLFIDNVDQHSPTYQAQVFLLAQRITRSIQSVTLVSLREESYYCRKAH